MLLKQVDLFILERFSLFTLFRSYVFDIGARQLVPVPFSSASSLLYGLRADSTRLSCDQKLTLQQLSASLCELDYRSIWCVASANCY